jgi:adenine-specific DNA-methyltransferase
VGTKRSLLVLCAAFRGNAVHWPNLTVKKIPKQVLSRCEWGHDDYSLKVENLPEAPPQPFALEGEKRVEATRPVKSIGDMDDLFGDLE